MSRTHPGLADDTDWIATLVVYDTDVRAVIRGWFVDPHTIDDVAQDTYLEAMLSRDTYDSSLPVLPWLLQIARRAAMRRWRTEHGCETVALDALPDVPHVALHEVGSDEHVRLLATRSALGRALGRLTPRQLRLLWRWEFERRSTAQLAAEENVSPAALRQGVKRACSTARERFIEAGGERPTPVLVPVFGSALARLRARWSRLAADGWPDTLVACAVPAVAAGMLLGVWPVPSPTGGPQPQPAPHRPAAVVTTPSVAPEAPAAGEDGAAPAAKPPPSEVLPAPAAPTPAPSSPPERIGNKVDVVVPGARTEHVLVVEIYCDTGIVTTVACAATPD